VIPLFVFILGQLIFFYFLVYHLRLLARGIARALRCRHKHATAGIRSGATAQGPTGIGASTDATTGRPTYPLFAIDCLFWSFVTGT
jgi:hypothetical protein